MDSLTYDPFDRLPLGAGRVGLDGSFEVAARESGMASFSALPANPGPGAFAYAHEFAREGRDVRLDGSFATGRVVGRLELGTATFARLFVSAAGGWSASVVIKPHETGRFELASVPAGRARIAKPPTDWWSLEPSEWPTLGEFEVVAGQVATFERP